MRQGVGLSFAHPESHYFASASWATSQVEDYAKRKGMTMQEEERWLGPWLGVLRLSVALPKPAADAVKQTGSVLLMLHLPWCDVALVLCTEVFGHEVIGQGIFIGHARLAAAIGRELAAHAAQ